MSGLDGPPPGLPVRARRLGVPQAVFLGLLLLVPIVIGVMLAAPPFVCACTPTARPPLASPIEGIVRSVDSAGLGDVRGFVLLTTVGESIDFKLGPLENPVDFPPAHLAEHQASSQPVRVYFRSQHDEYVVYRLEDAADPIAS